MKVAFITLGCKVNSYESDAIAALYKARGDEVVSSDDLYDACIINTCSVTNQATAKSRKLIRAAIRHNPDAIYAVIGCYSQMAKEEVMAIDGVDIVLGNIEKASVISLIDQKLKGDELVSRVDEILRYHEFENLNPVDFNRTRAFLKIEDGCNNFCTYCIIPFTRGPVRSKPYQDVINDINKIVENGYQEVVLTGIHTGRYLDGDVHFTDLVKMILTETKLKRLRISSIELNEITDEFLEMLKNGDVIANHLHLPLQAGSNHTLKMMNRHYTREEFIERIAEIRTYSPTISITTDIIVGFPEETVEDFNDTLQLCKEVKFAKIHAFPFSLRKGTKACDFKQVSEITKKLRMEKLLELDKELQEEYQKVFVGTTQTIIGEDKHDGYILGHSSNYLPILVPYQKELENKMFDCIITEYKDGKLYGMIKD